MNPKTTNHKTTIATAPTPKTQQKGNTHKDIHKRTIKNAEPRTKGKKQRTTIKNKDKQRKFNIRVTRHRTTSTKTKQQHTNKNNKNKQTTH